MTSACFDAFSIETSRFWQPEASLRLDLGWWSSWVGAAVCRSVDGRRIQTFGGYFQFPSKRENYRKTHIQWKNSIRVASGPLFQNLTISRSLWCVILTLRRRQLWAGAWWDLTWAVFALTTALACSWDHTLLSSTMFAMIFESHMMF